MTAPRRHIPTEFTELLGAALLYWLDEANGGRATRARTDRLLAAVTAASPSGWPIAAAELYKRAEATLNGEPGILDKTAIVDAAEACWPRVATDWTRRADCGDGIEDAA